MFAFISKMAIVVCICLGGVLLRPSSKSIIRKMHHIAALATLIPMVAFLLLDGFTLIYGVFTIFLAVAYILGRNKKKMAHIIVFAVSILWLIIGHML
ncbi:MAG: hypothetical protein ACRC5C_05330 [Bacilli bacterium]